MCPDLYSTTDQVLTATSPKVGLACTLRACAGVGVSGLSSLSFHGMLSAPVLP